MPYFRRNLAFLIGVNDYRNGLPALRTPVGDSRAIADLLGTIYHYEVFQRDLENITRDAFLSTFANGLTASVGSDDRVIFYFAGHGFAEQTPEGVEGHLLFSDARQDIESFVSMRTLYQILSTLPCRHLLVVLDCCFAGAFRWASSRSARAGTVLYRERYEHFLKFPAWQVIASAAQNEDALDVAVGKPLGMRESSDLHSPFAEALLVGLDGAAHRSLRPAGLVITCSELYSYLLTAVGVPQTPRTWPLARHGQGEFLFELEQDLSHRLPSAEVLTENTNPYRGLEPFDESHSTYYYGRERVSRALAERACATSLTVVVAPSGSGKTSLLRVGLPAALADMRSRGQEETDSAPLLAMRPSTDPVKALSTLLRSHSQMAPHLPPPSGSSTIDEKALDAFFDQWQAPGSCRPSLIVVVDQLEELFTLCIDVPQRAFFLSLLRIASRQRQHDLSIVAALRADFEPLFMSVFDFSAWRDIRLPLSPMDLDELRDAIELPAARRVLFFEEPALVDQLLEEVVQMPGSLPLLSFTLSELYLRYVRSGRGNRELCWDDYNAIGGVLGSLRQKADEVLRSLPDRQHQETLRRVLLRMVATGHTIIARRRVELAELKYSAGGSDEEDQRVQLVLKRLLDARLVTFSHTTDADGSPSQPFVEPAHESLIRNWDKMILWRREASETIALQRRIAEACGAWRDATLRRARHAALWNKSSRLEQASELLAQDPHWLNSQETSFIRRSLRRRLVLRLQRLGLAAGACTLLAVLFYRGATLSHFIHFWTIRRAATISLRDSKALAQSLGALVDTSYYCTWFQMYANGIVLHPTRGTSVTPSGSLENSFFVLSKEFTDNETTRWTLLSGPNFQPIRDVDEFRSSLAWARLHPRVLPLPESGWRPTTEELIGFFAGWAAEKQVGGGFARVFSAYGLQRYLGKPMTRECETTMAVLTFEHGRILAGAPKEYCADVDEVYFLSNGANASEGVWVERSHNPLFGATFRRDCIPR
jgi:hypothetical protein